MARYLHARGQLLGMAYLPGRLYDLGSYPGAVYDPAENQMVTGQVYRLEAPEATFPELDRYEGVSLDPTVQEEYVRLLVNVLFDQQQIPCWIYHYNLDTDRLPQIHGGNYLEYFSQHCTHRQFINNGR